MAIKVDEGDGGMMAEINTTPLVDIMLVLLIIFLVTIPVITDQVPVELPNAENIPTETRPQNIVISVAANGDTFFGTAKVRDRDQLFRLLAEVAVRKPQPEVHVRADKEVRYEYVGRVVVICQQASIQKVGFITEPKKQPGGA